MHAFHTCWTREGALHAQGFMGNSAKGRALSSGVGCQSSRTGVHNAPSHADFDDKMLDMITDIAAAFEMVHMASLVHDDIIDGSAHRRGKPALHLTWGTHSAVLAGDYLFAQANSTVVKHAGLGIAACLSDAVGLMCRGERLPRTAGFTTQM